jgi:hypothetical protein
MKRNTLNFIVVVVTALVMFGMVATGLVVRFVLPPGSGSRRALWGLGRHDWGDLHFWLAVGIGVLVLVHVALHWQWVCATALRLFRRGATEPVSVSRAGGNLAGFGLLILIVGFFAGFAWLAQINVQEVRDGGGSDLRAKSGHEEGEAGSIHGSMTLAEVAAAKNISVETLRARLGLPASVAPDERMGRTCRQYGFSMPEARKRIETQTVKPTKP